MILKRKSDAKLIQSATCGQIMEFLNSPNYDSVSFTIVYDAKPSVGHYHNRFDELYFLEDGEMTIRCYETGDNQIQEIELGEGDLIVFPKQTHHQIKKASIKNKLIVVSVPRWQGIDEVISDKL